jgi:hypothetical protein
MINLSKIHKPVSDCPKSFRYPVGYFESPDRVTDPDLLKDFDRLLHPYVIKTDEGKIWVDPKAPHAVARLESSLTYGDDENLKSAMRFLELGGAPDEAMEANHACEDRLSWADLLSQTGHHGKALAIVDALPDPFQDEVIGHEVRLRGLKALGRFAEALPHVESLVLAYKERRHAHCYQVSSLNKAELLVALGEVDAAEALLNEKGRAFGHHYQYCGIRAGIALARGDRLLAKMMVSGSISADYFHCYKLLWLRGLEGLTEWMGKELVSEDGESRPYEEHSELLRFVYRIQGCTLAGDAEEASVMADIIGKGEIHEGNTAFEIILVWLGVGDFARARRWARAQPCHNGCRRSAKIHQICDWFLEDSDREQPEWSHAPVTPDLENSVGYAIRGLAEHFRKQEPASGGNEPGRVVAEIWHGSFRAGRRVWIIAYEADGQLVRVLYEQPKDAPWERRCQEFDPRTAFRVVERTAFITAAEVAAFLEDKLARNDGVQHRMYGSPPHSLRLDGGATLRLFSGIPLTAYPRLLKCWQSLRDDPNLYFQLPGPFIYAKPTAFDLRVYSMVAAFMRHWS